MFSRENQIWDYILENGIATEETLKVVTSINGYSEEALNDLLYAVTGYRYMEQIEDEEWKHTAYISSL